MKPHILLPVFFLCLAPVFAEPPEPQMIVSFAGFDALREDLAVIAKTADNPGLPAGIRREAEAFFGESLLASLDGTRPAGYVQRKEQAFIFLPMTDISWLSAFLAWKFDEVNIEEQEHGVRFVRVDNFPFYVVTKGDYTYLGFANAEALSPDNLPEDPEPMLEGLNKKYTLAMVNRYDAELSEEPASEEKEEKNAEEEADDHPRYFENGSIMISWYVSSRDGGKDSPPVIRQSEIGFFTDKTSSEVCLEASVERFSGTEAAELSEKYRDHMSAFSSFPGMEPMLSFHGVLTVDAMFREALRRSFHDRQVVIFRAHDRELEKEVRAVLAELTDPIRRLADEIAEEEVLDMGLAVFADPEEEEETSAGMTFLAGVAMKEPAKAEEAFRELRDTLYRKVPGFREEWVRMDFAEEDGMRFHEIRVPCSFLQELTDFNGTHTEEYAEYLAKHGDYDVGFVMGVTEHEVVFGIGKNAVAIMKEIRGAPRSEVQTELCVSGSRFLKYSMRELKTQNPTDPEAIYRHQNRRLMCLLTESILENWPGEDHIRMTVQPTETGYVAKMKLEKGIVSILGALGIVRMMAAEF